MWGSPAHGVADINAASGSLMLTAWPRRCENTISDISREPEMV